MILLAGFFASIGGFSVSCNCGGAAKCKKLAIVCYAAAVLLSLLGAFLLAIPYSFCEQESCYAELQDTSTKTGCKEYNMKMSRSGYPDVDAPVCTNLAAESNYDCGKIWCVTFEGDCGDKQHQTEAECDNDCSYWGLNTEDDCNAYAEYYVAGFVNATIAMVLLGFLFIAPASVGGLYKGVTLQEPASTTSDYNVPVVVAGVPVKVPVASTVDTTL